MSEPHNLPEFLKDPAKSWNFVTWLRRFLDEAPTARPFVQIAGYELHDDLNPPPANQFNNLAVPLLQYGSTGLLNVGASAGDSWTVLKTGIYTWSFYTQGPSGSPGDFAGLEQVLSVAFSTVPNPLGGSLAVQCDLDSIVTGIFAESSGAITLPMAAGDTVSPGTYHNVPLPNPNYNGLNGALYLTYIGNVPRS